jgi:uncharacterized DUF497 family protein
MKTRTGEISASTMSVLKLPFLSLTIRLPCDYSVEEEERWITVGAVGPASILLVVHVLCEEPMEQVIRIISARAAESHERKAYAEAHKRPKARRGGHRRKKRHEH